MTARHPQPAKREHPHGLPLPDPPEREPEDMTSFDHLTLNGGAHHLGNPDTTIIAGERYLTGESRPPTGWPSTCPSPSMTPWRA